MLSFKVMTMLFSLETAFNILMVVLSFFYWGVVFIILYHLTRFGIGVQPKRLAATFLFGSMVLFSVSVILRVNIDINALIKMI